VGAISFYVDSRGFTQYRTDDDRLIPLGIWFSMELRDSPYQCLDLLAIIDDVASGREAETRWEGEAFEVDITRAGAHVVNTILDDHQATYSLAELTAAAEEYWVYLAGNPRMAEDITDWERTWKRSHPYRGRLF
jgi:hypothetical protein